MKPEPLDKRSKCSLLGGEILLYPVYGKTPRAPDPTRPALEQLMLHDNSAYRLHGATWYAPPN